MLYFAVLKGYIAMLVRPLARRRKWGKQCKPKTARDEQCRTKDFDPVIYVLIVILGFLHGLPAWSQTPIEGDSWFPMGPAPINNFFGGGVTGRASAIAVNANNADELWIGGAAGGVWHSVNGGRNWVPVSDIPDNQEALAIGALAVDRCDNSGCEVIYAGTGENAIRRDTYYGRGLMIRDNRPGTEFPTWVTLKGDPFNFELGSINDVVLDPTTSVPNKRIFVTLSSGTTSSASQATVTAPEPSPGGYGIYRSDNNGGTWSKLDIQGAENARPTDLEMDPEDQNVLYAGFLGVGMFKTTDGGNTWCPLNAGIPLPAGCTAASGLDPDVTGGFDHVEIAIQRENTQALYVTFGHCADRLIQGCTPSVFRTSDGGSSWNKRRQGTISGSATNCPTVYSRYTHGLAIHPNQFDRLFLGGTRLCRSDDGGQTFVTSDNNTAPGTSPWGPIIHLDHREIIIHPSDANRMYSTDDGGFAFSNDGGSNWTPGNNDLQITGFYSLTSVPNTPRVLGGAQDNAGQLWKGFRAWDRVGNGDGGYALIDLDDPMTLYLGSNFGSFTRSTNGGLSFSTISPPGTSSSNRAFNAPVVQNRELPHELYYGADRLFCSTTDGSNWVQASPVLATGTTDEITPGINVITAIGVHAERVYFGYYGGQVFTTDDGCDTSASWTEVSDGLPNAPVTDIAVDPDTPSTAYLTFSGFSEAAHVWKTTNAGGSWTAVDNGLPEGVPANAIAIEPDFPSRVWVGLDSGPNPDRSNVYRSTDGGTNWESRDRGLPNAPVFDLSIDDSRGRIYAGLHGRGAYVLSQPLVGGFEGWVDGNIWDIPVYGQNFAANQSCTVSLLQTTGDICASGSVDAIGGTIETDSMGVLGTTSGGMWSGKSVIWACLNGNCLGGTPIAECNDDENGDGIADRVSTVVVDCGGGPPGNATIPGCPNLTNPPGSLIEVGFFEEGDSPLSTTASTSILQRAISPRQGDFRLAAILQSREGAIPLCTVPVSIMRGDNSKAILERARDAINSDPSCTVETVTASLDEISPEEEEEEDKFRRDPRLLLSAPGQTGGQIVAGLLSNPSAVADGTCFTVRGLGMPMLSQLRVMRTTFLTDAEGAQGGQLIFIETSGLGTCAVTLESVPGQTAGQIAQALTDLILDADSTPKPFCPEEMNPRDIGRDGDSITSVFASDLQICLNDPGIGVLVAPEEIEGLTPSLVCDPNTPGAIIGTAGNDLLIGTPGDDVITGLEGNDSIFGRGGNDCIDGGGGDDRIFTRDGDDQIIGDSGDDIIASGSGSDTVTGGPGNDQIYSGAGNDRITAGSGDDRIFGGDGNDEIDGGSDDDRIIGGQGSDTVTAGPGNDQLFGGAGNDRISGGPGDDQIFGGDGNDEIDGGPANDQISGGQGTDTCLNGESVFQCE